MDVHVLQILLKHGRPCFTKFFKTWTSIFYNFLKDGRPDFQNLKKMDVHVFVGRPCFLDYRPIVQHPWNTTTRQAL